MSMFQCLAWLVFSGTLSQAMLTSRLMHETGMGIFAMNLAF